MGHVQTLRSGPGGKVASNAPQHVGSHLMQQCLLSEATASLQILDLIR